MQPYEPTQPPRMSKSAMTGFVVSLLGCIPVVTSVVGLVFGIIGFRNTASPMVRGRGFAIAAIVLSLVGLAGWSAIGFISWQVYANSDEPRLAARAFVEHVAAGDFNEATAASDANMPSADLQKAIDYFEPYGTLVDLSVTSISTEIVNGVSRWKFGGTMTWSDGRTNIFEVTVRDAGNGTWLVETFNFK